MVKSHILQANWYDYPHYYDIAFQAYTRCEADFIEAACRKYCRFATRRFLEPACGSGRLITELAARGYQLTGFDLNQPALNYLRRRLARRRLHAETFEAQMSDFRIDRPIDAVYCTVGTFRYLLTEQTARNHLKCIAGCLRPGGIYVLGFHLQPLSVDKRKVLRWTQRRGETKVTVTLRGLCINHPRRIERLRVCLLVRRGSKRVRLRHEFEVRTYTAKQFRRLLDSVPSLELCDVYDFRYDIERPLSLDDEITYALFVLRRRLPSLFLRGSKAADS
jgi:SAM-dependent methyltransferase